MNRQFKFVFCLVGVLAVFLSACTVQQAQAHKLSASAEKLAVSLSAANELMAGQNAPELTSDGGITVESSQVGQAAAPVEETMSNAIPEGVPSLEERTKMLDGVNPSIPIIRDETSPAKVAGPNPGTESGPVELEKPIASSSNVDSPETVSDTSSGTTAWSFKAFTVWLSTILSSFFTQ